MPTTTKKRDGDGRYRCTDSEDEFNTTSHELVIGVMLRTSLTRPESSCLYVNS